METWQKGFNIKLSNNELFDPWHLSHTQIPFIIFIFCRISEFIAIPNDKITKTKYRNGSKSIIEYRVQIIVTTNKVREKNGEYLLVITNFV